MSVSRWGGKTCLLQHPRFRRSRPDSASGCLSSPLLIQFVEVSKWGVVYVFFASCAADTGLVFSTDEIKRRLDFVCFSRVDGSFPLLI